MAEWAARVPWAMHAFVVAFLLLGCGLTAWGLHEHLTRNLQTKRLELQALEQQLFELTSKAPVAEPENFTASLPLARSSDDLVQFMSAQAKTLNVQVGALSVRRTSGTATELGRVQFQVSFSGTYGSVKSLLADLLGRYPTLGVQTMNWRVKPQQIGLSEADTLLIWYVKD